MPTEEQIKTYRNPVPTTDTIIEYTDGKKEGIVLITRKNPPYGLALPGGFAEWGITLEDNARKEAKEETNLEVILENPNRQWVYSNPDRDPREHTIANVYMAKGSGILQAGDDAREAEIFSIPELKELIAFNELAFDHGEILTDYLKFKGEIIDLNYDKLGKVGLVGRFKPLHNGGATLLTNLCGLADEVVIGVGSSNKYNVHNPFTADETISMVDSYLSRENTNYGFLSIPDFAKDKFDDGQRWKKEVIRQFGNLDTFVTGNAYVAELLADTYRVVHPFEIIEQSNWTNINSSKIRLDMAQGNNNWINNLPMEVVQYLSNNDIVSRFAKEFGAQTIEIAKQNKSYTSAKNVDNQRKRITVD